MSNKKLKDKLNNLLGTSTASRVILGDFNNLTELQNAYPIAPDGAIATVSSTGTIYNFDQETTTWTAGSGGSGISDVVDDTTPQLGGTLDLNNNAINGTGAISYTGNFGNVGLFQTAGAATFLNTLTAIGVVTTIDDVGVGGDLAVTGASAFSSTLSVGSDLTVVGDTFAQGNANVTGELGVEGPGTFDDTLDVDSDLTVNGDIIVAGSVDGRDVAADGTKLDLLNIPASIADIGTPASGDKILIQDITDSDNLKYVAFSEFAGGGISNVVEDTTPQLGGNLDTNGNNIISSSGFLRLVTAASSGVTVKLGDSAGSTFFSILDSSDVGRFSVSSDGDVATGGTVDGRDLSVDGAKLDTIESNADVTDEANVTAALSGATLTDVGTPASTDKILLLDASDSDNLKYADFSEFGGGVSDHGALTGLTDDDHTQYAIISSGSGAPATTPPRVGAIYVDTTGDVVYVAVGTASSADWQEQVLVNGTGLAAGSILVFDGTEFIADPKTTGTGTVTTLDMNSIVGNFYSTTTASTASSYTLQNAVSGGRSTIRIQNATSGGPTFAGTGITVVKKGDWSTNYDTTNVNTIYIEMVTATLAWCWITAVD